MSAAAPPRSGRLAPAILAGVAAVLLTLASIPFAFGPLIVAAVLMAIRTTLRRTGGPLAEPVARALGIVALFALLCGLALAASYGVGGGQESPREPATEVRSPG